MSATITPHPEFEGVYIVEYPDGTRFIATKSLARGVSVYGERVIRREDEEYRIWDPYRSKLAAALLKNLKHFPFRLGIRVLYLGAASGTTVSHVSDIVGETGVVYAVEFAQRVFRDLIQRVVQHRPNVVPIFADARLPADYSTFVDAVDVVYCDIAQPFQADVLADNTDYFLRPGGSFFLAIKAPSIDVTAKPSEVFAKEKQRLVERGLKILEDIDLRPYDEAHRMVVGVRPA
ncbi:fibrillarin-like rRNA/tRNA 2'-O-methyltransferase [archaeon]|nr:fibrillarin-like rRNA/tRNA 2'-O-methyltransferase [archaeon]